MATWQIQGFSQRDPTPSLLASGLPPGTVVIKHAVQMQGGRAAGPPMTLDGIAPDDALEIELQDGVRLWTRADDFRADFITDTERGALADDLVVVPATLKSAETSRGLAGGLAIRALKVLGIDLEGSIVRIGAEKVESRLKPGPGLYRCSASNAAGLQPIGTLPEGSKTLVLLHGTGSTTCASFKELWDPSRPMGSLFQHYGGRVLGFEHETLTKSPIANAVGLVAALARHLPADAEVHLLSHSRGGLVGELLARGMRVGALPFTPDDLALFSDDARASDLEGLNELNALLSQARLRVTKFVRIACPARGTTLADGRLDRYFSVLVNLASFVPGLPGDVLDGLTSLLAGILKQRTNPRELPGLEAMLPESPLVRMLNTPGVVTDADLHVLGGDLEGEGLFGRLKTLITDAYYREDHDLVVNTPSMLGGTARTQPVRYWIDQGASVTHFHYFSRPDTGARLTSALKGDSSQFHVLEAEPSSVSMDDYRKRAATPQPTVVVVPGIMGSELRLARRRVWLDLLALAGGGLSRLGADAAGVEATGLVANNYADLCRFLANSHTVVPFPYDWRLGIGPAGDRLATTLSAIADQTEATNQPVRIIAHSMGGLVVRAMLATKAGAAVWARLASHPASRIVMLGTPNGGSHAIAALLLGRDSLVRKLALLDLRHDHAGLLETIAAFDGVLDLLPGDVQGLDLFNRKTWDELFLLDAPQDRGIFGAGGVASSKSAGFQWTPPAAARLQAARKRRESLLSTLPQMGRLIYVAGVADETASDVVIDRQAEPTRRVKVMATTEGDGRVLWSTGIPQGAAVFYMDATHGDLASTGWAFPALLDLLTSGHTSKLPVTPPRRRSARQTFELHVREPEMLPDEADLVASATGGTRSTSHRKDAPDELLVRVVHGNLEHASSAVLIGHYQDDVIVGAEAYLDRQLNRRLSELQRMELYVGALPSAVAVLNETGGPVKPHPGAIVAGLGRVGELTPGRLASALEHALTTYGAEWVARIRRERQRASQPVSGDVVHIAVTSLLVGSGEGGVALADSVKAITRAIASANRRLGATGDPAAGSPALAVRISRLDIVELYEDRAIEAAHALQRLARSGSHEGLVISDLLQVGRGGLRRPRYDPGAPWWQRIRVTAPDDRSAPTLRDPAALGGLQFEALTHISRAHAALQPMQRALVDGFVAEAQGTTANAPGLGSTLFELLVPNDFKPYAPERERLALVLDAQAAALPWELLENKYDKGSRPLAVESGMIRQLIVDGGRARPERAPGPTALVIGNPIVADPRFPSLAGAEAEANDVAALLASRGCTVMSLVGVDATPMAVVSALHDRPWRVLHLAAHGVFQFVPEPGAAPVSGLVLDGGIFLTPSEAQSMRHVPDLVFVNCCHLGQTSGDTGPQAFHRLAANLATEFIRMGARAVVAAGWAVNDAAARTFARTFYDLLFDGWIYGEAVAGAREATYKAHGDTNTWGAYQCYGDPSFSLGPIRSLESSPVPVAASEFVFEVDRLAARAAVGDLAEHERLRPQLANLARSCATSWLESSSVLTKLAEAYGELGDFETAASYYTRAMNDPRADVPLRALEQLVNVQVRAARARMDERAARGVVVRWLREAEALLGQVERLGRSAERAGLRGGLEKCWAMAGGKAEKSLQRMRAAYAAAFDQASADDHSARAHALANRIAAEVVQGWFASAGSPQLTPRIEADLDELDRIAARLADESTESFDRMAAVNGHLMRALASGSLPASVSTQLRDAYETAATLGLSARKRDSIVGQLRFFERMALVHLPPEKATPLAESLRALESGLRPDQASVFGPQASGISRMASRDEGANAPARRRRKPKAPPRRPRSRPKTEG